MKYSLGIMSRTDKKRSFLIISRDIIIMPREYRKKKFSIKCIRCSKSFPSIRSLKAHTKTHLHKLKEMSMLQEGHIPGESKIGSGFKGKNRVVIS